MPRRWLLLALFLAALAWIVFEVGRAPELPPGTDARPDTSSTGFRAARVFFASVTGDSLVAESRELLDTPNLHDRVSALVAELERGPEGRALGTLPAGTAVRHVYLDDRGLLTLDLTAPFRTGFRGGSTAEYLAVASLVRTLGANLGEVRRVLLVCAGEPVTTLAGHLPLDRPIDVSDLP
jgi:Sporulation and spore germination